MRVKLFICNLLRGRRIYCFRLTKEYYLIFMLLLRKLFWYFNLLDFKLKKKLIIASLLINNIHTTYFKLNNW